MDGKTTWIGVVARVGVSLGLATGLAAGLLVCLGQLNRAAVAAATLGPAGVEITIHDFFYSPSAVTIAPGTTVTWRNLGSFTHTADSDTLVWDSGDLAPGGTFSYTFNATGTFPFHCDFHPSMQGVVVVAYRVFVPLVVRLGQP